MGTINRNKSKVAVVEEVTEGLAVDPTLGEQFIQITEAISLETAREVVESEALTPNKGKAKSRATLRSASGTIPVYWKASGTEGSDDLETDILYRSMLGGKMQITTRDAVEAGSTVDTFNVTGHGLVKGQFLHILEPGAHHLAFVKNVIDANSFEITPPMPNAPTDGTEYAESTTYFASVDEPTFTLSDYWGDALNEQHRGCRVSACSFEEITTGGVPKATFSYQGLDYDEALESAPVTPIYNNSVAPIALGAIIAKDGTCFDMNEATLNIENTVSLLPSVKSESGNISSLITERVVTGSITPFLDDASLEFFNNYNNNEDIEVVYALAIPSATQGEYTLGTAVGAYMPQCSIENLAKSDLDGTMVRNVEFSAHAGSTGAEIEIFLGFA